VKSGACSASWHCKASFQPSQLAPIGRIAEFKQKHETMEKHSKTLVFSNSSEQKENERNLFKKPFIANDALHQTAPCTTMHHHFHV
jgi:hypothetical protein